MMKKYTTANILTVLFAAAIALTALASCVLPNSGGSVATGGAGTVTVRLGTAAQARAATAPTSELVSTFDVTLTPTDVNGVTHTATATATGVAVGSKAVLADIPPGEFTVSVTTHDKNTNENGTGTGSVTLSEGGSESVTVPVTVSQSGKGTGSIELAITFPTNVNIGDVTASFIDDAAKDISVSRTFNTALADGKATFTASDVPAGIRYLSIEFKEGPTVIGRIVEAVNVWNGVKTNLWLSSAGTTTGIRAFTMDDITTSSSKLAALTVAGKTIDDLDTAATASGVDITGTGPTDYIADDKITFVPIANYNEQPITCTWNGGASFGIGSGDDSPGLTTNGVNGINTLTVTAKSQGDAQSTTYTVTFTRAYKVNFSSAYGTLPAAQTILHGDTATEPANPSASGFEFGGWYKDTSYSTPWVFGTGGTTVTAPTTLYAKWTTLGAITAYITEPQYLGIYFKQFGNVITSTTLDKDATLTLSVPAGGTNYEWTVSDSAGTQSTTQTYAFSPATLGITAGFRTVSVVAKYGDVTYAGNLAITITNDAMVTVIPSGLTATYENTSINSIDINSYDSTKAIAFYNKLSPYSIAKTETTYLLWYTVYTWAINHGYTFQNEGTPSKGAGYTGEANLATYGKYPVGNINRRDMLVWCNAYTEMRDGNANNACYTYDGTVLRDSRDANATACDNAIYDRTKTGYRLPTESEWQFAATGCGENSYDRISGYKELAWAAAPTGTDYNQYIVYWHNANMAYEVAQKKPNELGLFDMSGNAWETCADVFSLTYPTGTTYTSPETNYCATGPGTAVIRSGSYGCELRQVLTGYRQDTPFTTKDLSNGFRLARTIP